MSTPEEAVDEIRRKAERMVEARRRRVATWENLVHVGALGFLVVVPTALGAALGRLAGRSLGSPSLALAGLLLGLFLGGYAAWRHIRSSLWRRDAQ